MWILIVVIAVLLAWLGLLTWKHRELRAQFFEIVTRVPIVGAKGPTADAVWQAAAQRIMTTKVNLTSKPVGPPLPPEQQIRDRLPLPPRSVLYGCPSNECAIRDRCTGHAGCPAFYPEAQGFDMTTDEGRIAYSDWLQARRYGEDNES